MAVRFHGRLRPGTAAKDAALEILRRLSVKGGLGYILEYSGDGVEHLSLTERMTIANMSIETGATSGVFVSNAVTQAFLADQGRGEVFRPLAPDADAVYDAELDIDLSALRPLTACPSSPDAVVPVSARREVVPGSVFIGSCTNSSYADIARAAAVMRGRHVAPGIDCVIAPGSHQIYERLLADGAIETLVRAGCRILECACGPCIWRETVTEIGEAEFPDVALDHMLVDSAAQTLVCEPSRFDVLVTTSIFGDILSDEAGVLTGSIGMLPSAAMNDKGFGLFEPIHGVGIAITGLGIANPLASIMAAAMLLRDGLGLAEEGAAVDRAVARVLRDGYRTGDIYRGEPGQTLVNTEEMGRRVAERITRE